MLIQKNLLFTFPVFIFWLLKASPSEGLPTEEEQRVNQQRVPHPDPEKLLRHVAEEHGVEDEREEPDPDRHEDVEPRALDAFVHHFVGHYDDWIPRCVYKKLGEEHGDGVVDVLFEGVRVT